MARVLRSAVSNVLVRLVDIDLTKFRRKNKLTSTVHSVMPFRVVVPVCSFHHQHVALVYFHRGRCAKPGFPSNITTGN